MIFRRDPLANPQALIRRVGSYVAYRIGEGADAEDVTSEVFERALRYRESYDPSRGEPVAWLIGIARRCIDDMLRTRPTVTADVPDVADPADLEAQTIRRLSLAREVARLDVSDRELIALRFGADLTARQIGELLGMTKSAVDVALHRALARLRARLGEQAKSGSAESIPTVGDEVGQPTRVPRQPDNWL